jgi:hypothetical protein
LEGSAAEFEAPPAPCDRTLKADHMTDNAPRKGAREPSLANPRELAGYREAGLQLIPLHRHDYIDERGKRRGKSPRDGAWQLRDYGDFDAQAHMAAGYNVGVRLTDDWVVLDADPRNYPEGRNCLDELARKMGYEDGEAFCDDNAHVVTGSGGFQVFLRKSPETSFVDSMKDHAGIEFKSAGRQVVAAGSVHPETRELYRVGMLALPFSLARPVPSQLIEIAGRKHAAVFASGSGLKLSVAQVRHCLDRHRQLGMCRLTESAMG